MFNWYYCQECNQFKPAHQVGGRDKMLTEYGGARVRYLVCGHAVPSTQKPVQREPTSTDPMEPGECEAEEKDDA